MLGFGCLTIAVPRLIPHSNRFMGDGSLSDPQLPQDDARLAELSQRIDKLRVAKQEPNHMKKDYSQAQLAWRMVIELVAGLGIGFGIGYGLDTLMGTLPVFLVLFIGLGLAAGVKTMLRSAREVQERQVARAAAEAKED